MPEFFVQAHSFGEPFFSDNTEKFITADTAQQALELFRKSYTHPAGLYAAACYTGASSMKIGAKPLAKWLCNQEIEKQRLTKDLRSYGFYSPGPGQMEINGHAYTVANPKEGAFVEP